MRWIFGKSKIKVRSQSIIGVNRVKDVLDDLDKVKLQLSRHRSEAEESIKLLRKNEGEYNQLRTAYIDLLRQSAMAVLKW